MLARQLAYITYVRGSMSTLQILLFLYFYGFMPPTLSREEPHFSTRVQRMRNLLGPHKEKQTASRQFRHLGMIVLSVLVLIIAFTANIIVSAGLFSRTTRKYREEIITKTAKLAAEQIDGDKINQWLESGADDAYDNTAGLLQSI